jgi:hypothetical protein
MQFSFSLSVLHASLLHLCPASHRTAIVAVVVVVIIIIIIGRRISFLPLPFACDTILFEPCFSKSYSDSLHEESAHR